MKRLSQADRLLNLLKDGKEHGTPEIQIAVYGANHLGSARIAARAHDLRKRGYTIHTREEGTICYYRLEVKPRARVEYVNIDGIMHARVME